MPSKKEMQRFTGTREVEENIQRNSTEGSDSCECLIPPNFPSDYPFPLKLHYLLSELEKNGLSNIAGWSGDGRFFVIHNHDHFSGHIIPCWFRQTWLVFRRQLYLHEFRSYTTGRRHQVPVNSPQDSVGVHSDGYCHDYFLREKPHLSLLIKPHDKRKSPKLFMINCSKSKSSSHRHDETALQLLASIPLRIAKKEITPADSMEPPRCISTPSAPTSCALKTYDEILSILGNPCD